MTCTIFCVSAPPCTLGRVTRRCWRELHGAQTIMRCITFASLPQLAPLGRFSKRSWGRVTCGTDFNLIYQILHLYPPFFFPFYLP
ncbi:hypothetical protein FKM82_024135 [Ascaphus truei]